MKTFAKKKPDSWGRFEQMRQEVGQHPSVYLDRVVKAAKNILRFQNLNEDNLQHIRRQFVKGSSLPINTFLVTLSGMGGTQSKGFKENIYLHLLKE